MRIGLLSDTHIPEAMPQLWPQVFNELKNVDVILTRVTYMTIRCSINWRKLPESMLLWGTGTKDRVAEQSNVKILELREVGC